MITFYEFNGSPPEKWYFKAAELGRINLIVGASCSGKTRFLNTIFNFSNSIAKGKPFRKGTWNLIIKTKKYEYFWKYQGVTTESTRDEVAHESLTRKLSNGKEQILVERTPEVFKFFGKKLPKLERDKPSVLLLKEEEAIQPLYSVLSHVQRRQFHADALNRSVAVQNIPLSLLNQLKDKPNIEKLWSQDHTVQAKLFLFKECFKDLFDQVVNIFREIFPFIQKTEMKILKGGVGLSPDDVHPVFLIKEKGVKDWIPLQELSSGMQKVLLIITDIISLPEDSIYMIDEYENSLGVNAIDFLPQFLIEHGGNNQFFITTHHPYLINNMPMKNWLVFNRKGSEVRIKSGSEFESRYGKSKQKAFIQLLNDPFYSEEAQ